MKIYRTEKLLNACPLEPIKLLDGETGSQNLALKVMRKIYHGVQTMAAKLRTNHMMVARVWQEYGFKPHLIRQFKISNVPNFEEKFKDMMGLYLNPPENAVVFFGG
ncbi:hypothetical protein ACJJI3_05575 [Microbulbifer sp. ZKSA004]|uniref:hypothetical protein n=1 Tax=Microbulbifer sp. ZKSA004 TaxID=3243389 RepID=UPI0040392BD3